MDEGTIKPSEPAPRDFGDMTPKTAIEDVVMRQNSDFYRDRVLTYGSWENFLDAHGLMHKKEKRDSK